MTKKFKVENDWLLPTDPNKTYGIPKGIIIVIHGNKRDGFYAGSDSWYLRTSPIHGETRRTKKEAIDSLLMWLENSVDETTTEKDWK
ncbi:MAG: hypothetical protein J6U21_04915 [Bacteroidales bacterium]|nr:hypothetical protein [Bacteroidales bacterium]